MTIFIVHRFDSFSLFNDDYPSATFVVDVPDDLVGLAQKTCLSLHDKAPFWRIDKVEVLPFDIKAVLNIDGLPPLGAQEIKTKRAYELQPNLEDEFPLDRGEPVPETINTAVYYSLCGNPPRLTPHFIPESLD